MAVRDELRQTYDEFRRIGFPASATRSHQLGEIRTDLVEYDGHVAGIVESVLADAPIDISLLEPDRSLRARLELLRENSSAPTNAEAAEYLRYLARLDEMLDLATLVIRAKTG
jgi:hypothetical protein